MAAATARPDIVGPDAGPEPPYPLRMEGPVIRGFGRGSKELGIPTANLPVDEASTPWIADCVSGVYFGWAVVEGLDAGRPAVTAPMVMSIGYNPFYQNKARTAEVHVLHAFAADFYGAHVRLAVLGFIRPERGDYASVDALVADIRFDCTVARNALARPGWTPIGLSTGLAGGRGSTADAAGTLDVPWMKN